MFVVFKNETNYHKSHNNNTMKTSNTTHFIQLASFLVLLLLGTAGFAQLNSHSGSVKNSNYNPDAFGAYSPGGTKSSKGNMNLGNSYIGLGLGMRRFNIPNDVYVKRGENDYENLDLGAGKPFAAYLNMLFQGDENGLAILGQFEGFLGKNSGFSVYMGGGYKLGNDRFSVTPLASLGVGKLFTHLETYQMDSAIIPAVFVDPNSEAWLVGPGAENLERGGGGNLNYSVTNAFFSLKPELNVSVKASEKITIFGDIAYNIVFATTKNDFELTGMGYDNTDQLLNSDKPPHPISLEAPMNDVLVNSAGTPYEKTPVGMSGLSVQFGIGLNLD